MKEVEVLMQIHRGEERLETRLREVAQFVGEIAVDDQYYFDPLRRAEYFSSSGRFVSSFRLRKKDEKAQVTHKKDHFDQAGAWTYSDELETEVGDYDTFQQLIEALGFEKLVRLEMVKKTFLTDIYEIVLEEAKDLGIFLEVEAKTIPDGTDIDAVKNKIRAFIQELGIEGSESVSEGKAELLYKKQLTKQL